MRQCRRGVGTKRRGGGEGGKITLEGVLQRRRERGAELAAMRVRVEREMDAVMWNGVTANPALVTAAQQVHNGNKK